MNNKNLTKILIVDDHQMFIDGLKMILCNIKNISIVAEANSGLNALNILDKQEIDMVIADIGMPEMNGIELTKRIKTKHPDLKVLILSMHSDKEFVSQVVEAEAEGYILKNTGKQELLAAINKISDNGTYYSDEIISILTEIIAEEKLVRKKQIEKPAQLTGREKEIIKLIYQDYSSAEIADILFIAKGTVDSHRKNILKKINEKTIVGLIKYAIENNLSE